MEQLNLYLFHRKDRVHRLKTNSKITDTYFQNRRWQLVTFLEKMSGFWPHQSKLKKYLLQLYSSSIMLFAISLVVNKMRETVGTDINMVIECCVFLLIYSAVFFKVAFASACQPSRRMIYERVTKHFETISDPDEVAVLNKSADGAFKYTAHYMCIISFLLTTFNCTPVLRLFNDYLFNHRKLEMQMPVPLKYGFDHNKYWYIIVLSFMAWCYSALFIEFAYDLSYMLQVRHVAALFKIVGIRLGKVSELADFENGNICDNPVDRSYSLISSAINLHSECFEVVKLIQKSYTMSWFVLLLISTGGFGAGVHVVYTKYPDPIETFRYALVFVIVVLHYQMVFYEGQLIIDSAQSVSDACCECKWYGLPKKSCNLLSMMMIRTSIPCELTGAKLFPLSMESFSKMLKAGLSYYTVFGAN